MAGCIKAPFCDIIKESNTLSRLLRLPLSKWWWMVDTMCMYSRIVAGFIVGLVSAEEGKRISALPRKPNIYVNVGNGA